MTCHAVGVNTKTYEGKKVPLRPLVEYKVKALLSFASISDHALARLMRWECKDERTNGRTDGCTYCMYICLLTQ
ncbi:hypothetical protein POVWA2_051890 [Plasmodium ovale wallikeri]|uniref:Uncharacterized protein n=1 Tax=Plasmodium ovale wallikeri TaxID=864142 RepID=A0A1A8ZR48_PLAOA|nr:hypothetical protein POVWA1_052620 [Plasmodium ovale wallikeri]SBT46351.1 hypothetical protein POVWA2_051890 [Plasmodium ovale wallikeri]